MVLSGYQKSTGLGDKMLNQNDEVVVYFKNEDDSPYRLFGKFLRENDEYVAIESTVGDGIGNELIIPKAQIKMIEKLT